MKKDDKVFEVLVEIVRNFLYNSEKDIAELEKNIVENLFSKGYAIEEINDLLDGVFNLLNLDNDDFTLRILTEEELPNFSDEAKAYLIYLKSNFIIDDDDFEKTVFELSHNSNFNEINDIKSFLLIKGINPDITFN